MKVCSGCRSTRYCCRECQRDDWETHRTRCARFAKAHQDSRQHARILRETACVVCDKDVIMTPFDAHEFACGHKVHTKCHEERGKTTCASCGAFGAPVLSEFSNEVPVPRGPDGNPLTLQEIAAQIMSLRTPWYAKEDPMEIITEMLGYIFQVEKTARTGTDGTLEAERDFILSRKGAIPDVEDLRKVLRKYQQQAQALLPEAARLTATGPRVVRFKDLPDELSHELQKLSRGLNLALCTPFLAVPGDERFIPFVAKYLQTMGF